MSRYTARAPWLTQQSDTSSALYTASAENAVTQDSLQAADYDETTFSGLPPTVADPNGSITGLMTEKYYVGRSTHDA